jgi:uncharacterized protein
LLGQLKAKRAEGAVPFAPRRYSIRGSRMDVDSLELLATREGSVRVRILARARARGGPVGLHSVREGALVVRLAAAPVDGAANAELLETIADALGVPRRDVVLVRGNASREKTLDIGGLRAHEIRSRLAKAMP